MRVKRESVKRKGLLKIRGAPATASEALDHGCCTTGSVAVQRLPAIYHLGEIPTSV